MNQNSNFQRGQTAIKCLMGLAAILCIIALLVEGNGTTSSFSVYAAVTAVVTVVATAASVVTTASAANSGCET